MFQNHNGVPKASPTWKVFWTITFIIFSYGKEENDKVFQVLHEIGIECKSPNVMKANIKGITYKIKFNFSQIPKRCNKSDTLGHIQIQYQVNSSTNTTSNLRPI